MSVQSCGSGFIAQCPRRRCQWYVYSSLKDVALQLLNGHKCAKEST